ncbi:MAG: hypothetical protein NTZ34_04505, partial [Chloroflexi bacterium]|nr:hypothetical protein [Chloroflexota bacterium]
MKRLLPLLVLSLVMLSSFLPAAMVSAQPDGFVCTSIITLPATNVGDNSAKLNAKVELAMAGQSNLILVEDHMVCYTGYFQYGTQSGVYKHTTAPFIVLCGIQTQSFSIVVTGLEPCTKYYVRAVLSRPVGTNNQSGPAGYLISFLSTGSLSTGMRGLGVGLGAGLMESNRDFTYDCPDPTYGNVITFTTEGCQIRPLGQGSVGVGSGNSAVPSWPKPVGMSNIVVQSATIATPKVAPGEKVDITASVT